ncbi:MAG: hypothetical protein WCJ09_05545 [Planctomycetota bacterium]
MTTLVNYKGLQVVSPSPTGDGGLAIQDNFASVADWHPLSVWNETSDPGPTDDAGSDYFPGSFWLRTNTSPPRLFVCRDSTAGAAVWFWLNPPAVVLAPVATSDNVVSPASASVTPLTVKGVASQTADLTQWQTNSGTALLAVNSAGAIVGNTAVQLNTGSVQSAKADADTGSGNTRFLLYDNDSGQLQRVKVGASGTGPGGTGRALYLP